MTQQPNPKLGNLFTLEFPQVVATFGTYEDAQHAVDHLADADFPVRNLCIVGTDLRSVERVLGRRNWGTVLGKGVQSGLSTGIMVGLLMLLFYPGQNVFGLFAMALLIGIAIGVVFSAIGYWMSRGKRDFTSVSQTVATRYELLSEHKVAGQARELLAALPSVRQAAFQPQAASAPGHPSPLGFPGSQQQFPGQPPQGYPQPYPGQPFPSQPYPGQPFPGQPFPGQVRPGQTQPSYPGQGWANPVPSAPAAAPPAAEERPAEPETPPSPPEDPTRT